MAFVYLSIGTNLGNKEANLNQAMIYLREDVGDIYNISSFYSSKPWRFTSENEFSNAVVLVHTLLTPFEVLDTIKNIEKKMGRIYKNTDVYEDRLIDIDILFYDNLIIKQPRLTIPQKNMAERDFVLIPLTEITPDLIHPETHKTIREMRDELLSR